jgi:hypothetical protein
MKTLKMNLENLQGKMSRNELRNIMAGGSGANCSNYSCGADQLACCSSSDICSGLYKTSVCVKR